MSRQNRIDPFGQFHAVPAKGGLMGNRGILHDDEKNILKSHAHPNWVACALSYKGGTREIMAPNRYTELFFLDEATAFAAGHRPCATCRRSHYRAFTDVWQQVHGGPGEGKSLPQTIDRDLHKARITRSREKVTFEADVSDLPDGTMFSVAGEALTTWEGQHYRWSFDGYTPADHPVTGPVQVLTPAPVVAVFRRGYRPEVHKTLAGA